MTSPTPTLDLSQWPHIFVSSTHFNAQDLDELEDALLEAKANLTYDIGEAEIVLSKVTKHARILFDLRAKGLVVVPSSTANSNSVSIRAQEPALTGLSTSKHGQKRKRSDADGIGTQSENPIEIDDSSTESDEGSTRHSGTLHSQQPPRISPRDNNTSRSDELAKGHVVKVVRVDWFTNSVQKGRAEELDEYVTFKGTVTKHVPATGREATPTVAQSTPLTSPATPARLTGSQILARAKEDSPRPENRWSRSGGPGGRKFGRPATNNVEPASWEAGGHGSSQYVHLLQQTTTEHDLGHTSELPDPPDWVRKGIRYSCQRVTLAHGPNEKFIKLLKEIQQARLLTADEVGVRAYATSTAALAAYPYQITSPREILALPGCDVKIANLFVEWVNNGRSSIAAVDALANDPDLAVLQLFYEIWGVGATTAREFYYEKGWRDLDDIVEFGWKSLSRVQQIGVKYYDEFRDLIPRAEVEAIAATIHAHAVKVRDAGIQSMIVGGYRRGKEACGDVDVIVSHPDEAQTLNLVEEIVTSLEQDGWITHTLLLSLHNSQRGQQTLPFRGGGRSGTGFDTLDKALVVWQDPQWKSKEEDLARDPKAKNPNLHRRVDIIIAPWRTVGCAVVGW